VNGGTTRRKEGMKQKNAERTGERKRTVVRFEKIKMGRMKKVKREKKKRKKKKEKNKKKKKNGRKGGKMKKNR